MSKKNDTGIGNSGDYNSGYRNSGSFNTEEPIHEWFELSYGNYLVLQRSILQSMPLKWQKRFVKCLDELDEKTSNLEDLPTEFLIRAKEDDKFISDPYSNYERGRRIINFKNKANKK